MNINRTTLKDAVIGVDVIDVEEWLTNAYNTFTKQDLTHLQYVYDNKYNNVAYSLGATDPETRDAAMQVMLDEGTLIPAGTDTATPAPEFADAEEAQQAMAFFITEFLVSITGNVPPDEKFAWVLKEEAARAVIADTATTAQTTLLQEEANITGEALIELANKVIQKADIYRAVVGKTSGLRRATAALLETETDPFNYATILDNARTQAIQLKTDMGL